jgi:hypothetical protein
LRALYAMNCPSCAKDQLERVARWARPPCGPRFEGVPTVHTFPLVAGGARSYDHRTQLRYAFRLHPEPGQRLALARAFGCVRVVYNDAVRARQECP